jgi:hypothetical protein
MENESSWVWLKVKIRVIKTPAPDSERMSNLKRELLQELQARKHLRNPLIIDEGENSFIVQVETQGYLDEAEINGKGMQEELIEAESAVYYPAKDETGRTEILEVTSIGEA